MHLETSLANAVIDQMRQCNGIYIPPGIIPFYAADNTDFNEDTPDGKGTLHGTIIVVYQEDKDDTTKSFTLDPCPRVIEDCEKPKLQHNDRDFKANHTSVPIAPHCCSSA